MILIELNKNSKYGYRRRAWDIRYIGFDGADWKIVHPNGVTESLISANLEAMDWVLSDLPNMYYKRVAIVTKYVNGHPIGARIVLGKNHSWVLEDGTSDEEYYHLIGKSCEWEDEMEQKESPFPCFRAHKWNNYTFMFTASDVGEVVHGSDVFNVGHSSSNWVNYNDSIWEPCEDPRQKRKFKVGDRIRYRRSAIHTIAFIEDDRYRVEGNSYVLFTDAGLWELVSTAIQPSPNPEEPENLSCSPEPIPTLQKQKENKMDLRLLLAMMAAMSEEETPKDATNSKHVVIVTKDDAYEGYFYADDLDAIKDIVAEPKNELKKFHVFDYQTTLGQKPRKVVTVERS